MIVSNIIISIAIALALAIAFMALTNPHNPKTTSGLLALWIVTTAVCIYQFLDKQS